MTVPVSELRKVTQAIYMVFIPCLTTPPQKMILQLQQLLQQYWKHTKYRCMKMLLDWSIVPKGGKVWKKANFDPVSVARLQTLPMTNQQMELVMIPVRFMLTAVGLGARVIDRVLVVLVGFKAASAVQLYNLGAEMVVESMEQQVQAESKPERSQVPLVALDTGRRLQQKLVLVNVLMQLSGMERLQTPLMQRRSISQSVESHSLNADRNPAD